MCVSVHLLIWTGWCVCRHCWAHGQGIHGPDIFHHEEGGGTIKTLRFCVVWVHCLFPSNCGFHRENAMGLAHLWHKQQHLHIIAIMVCVNYCWVGTFVWSWCVRWCGDCCGTWSGIAFGLAQCDLGCMCLLWMCDGIRVTLLVVVGDGVVCAQWLLIGKLCPLQIPRCNAGSLLHSSARSMCISWRNIFHAMPTTHHHHCVLIWDLCVRLTVGLSMFSKSRQNWSMLPVLRFVLSTSVGFASFPCFVLSAFVSHLRSVVSFQWRALGSLKRSRNCRLLRCGWKPAS